MTPSNVDLIQMTDSAVARSNSDVFELNVHVVFSFDQLSAVDLAGGDFKGHDMVLRFWVLAFGWKESVERTRTHLGFIEKLDWYADSTCHGCGIAIVDIAA